MPKQLYKIIQFHGGLNSNSDARDIAENELSEATDVMVDELGKVRMMGGNTAQGAAARTNEITPVLSVPSISSHVSRTLLYIHTCPSLPSYIAR